KPSWGEVFSDTINTGIYMVEPTILEHIPESQNFDFAKDLFPKLMELGIDLWGYNAEGYWRDVGNPASYRDVYKDIFDGKISLAFDGEKQKVDNGIIYHHSSVKLPKKIKVSGTVVIDANTIIEDGVTLSQCCIGKNCNIDKHAEVTNTVLWNNVEIGTKSKINNSIICNDIIIKKEVKANLGIIVAEKCEIGDKVAFENDIMVWPEKLIDDNSVISNNVIWGTKYKSSIFENGRVVGRTNVELSVEMSTKLAEAFGSILPIGSKVYISRDYHKSSRMLKRAFLSGMLATGLDAVDLFNVPSNVMRHCLANHDEMAAGVHFRQSIYDPTQTEILLFSNDGMEIDSKIAKSIERIFFRENFRRVNPNEIGEVYEPKDIKNSYIKNVTNTIDKSLFKGKHVKVITDIMFGSTSDIYPKIMNNLGIENIILNAYEDDKSLSKIYQNIPNYQTNIENIVKAMNYSCGFLIYPNGQKLQIVDNNGKLIYDYIAMLSILKLINDTVDEKIDVFLPAWTPDMVEFENINITRGKLSNQSSSKLKEYFFIASTDGHFAFTEFGIHWDAVYASFKIIELLKKANTQISDIVKSLPKFLFRGENVSCPSEYKGKMMRKFLEDAKGKKVESIDGIKIWVSEDEWVLMVPDEHSDFLNLYIQAENERNGSKIFWEYQSKIEKWINE
ncbi:MAG: mannose-1-phosphate guanyltransferase, partial [Campylobacterales bacterium]|nr:mannose-1-phosphate guanyltransferase [Campylobacterales bacterium]